MRFEFDFTEFEFVVDFLLAMADIFKFSATWYGQSYSDHVTENMPWPTKSAMA